MRALSSRLGGAAALLALVAIAACSGPGNGNPPTPAPVASCPVQTCPDAGVLADASPPPTTAPEPIDAAPVPDAAPLPKGWYCHQARWKGEHSYISHCARSLETCTIQRRRNKDMGGQVTECISLATTHCFTVSDPVEQSANLWCHDTPEQCRVRQALMDYYQTRTEVVGECHERE